ncbi:MAG TPA: cytochrome c biogenesis protein CcdA [Kofleriaceae bacterium]
MLTRRRLTLLVAAAVVLVPALAFADDGGFAKYEARGLVWMYLASFGAGFLTSLTPCVYPLIPITLAVFGAKGKDVSRTRALALATSYVGGMGLTYSALGVVFSLIGEASGFGSQLASPWLVIPLAALFVALALSMFGLYEINLPSSWQTKLTQIGGKGYGGAFAMGLVAGLIAAPCTGPFLGSELIYVAHEASIAKGGTLLFVYALGMGVLFWVLAAGAAALPKSGPWMEKVKLFAGVLMMLEALNVVRPLLRPLRTFASPSMVFLAIALAVTLVGIVLALRGQKIAPIVMMIVGAWCAWSWKLTPNQHLPWIHDNEDAAFAQARAEHKGVMVDFAASWCIPCEEMELTFGDADVYPAITDHFVTLKLDVSTANADTQAKRDRYGAVTLPSVIFLDTNGHVLGRVNKKLEAGEMMDVLNPAIAKLP